MATVRKTQALFLSRTGAHNALIREGKKYGLKPEDVNKHGRAVAVSKRGEHIGFAAFLPHLPTGYIVEEA